MQRSAREFDKPLSNLSAEDLKTLIWNNSEEMQEQLVSDMVANMRTVIMEIVRASTAELHESVSDLQRELGAMKVEHANTKKENEKLKTVLTEHYRFLNLVNADRRSADVIITGLSENSPLINDDGHATDDLRKIKKIFREIGCGNTTITDTERLGKSSENDKRPVKVSLENSSDRYSILVHAKKLKESRSHQLRHKYIKRDTNPRDREELARLRDAYRRERQKPENVGRNVRLDYNQRKLFVDGLKVDHFHVQDF